MSERKVGTTSTTPAIARPPACCASASDERAQVRVDAVAELDDEGRIAAGEEAGLGGGWHGLNNRHRVAL